MADGASVVGGRFPPLSKADYERRAWSLPIERIQVADPLLFGAGAELSHFARLRRDAPVHRQVEHEFGPYWSITRHRDIMAVDSDHEAFSSEPAITIFDGEEDFKLPMFIAMDPPRHDAQRKTVSPAVSGPNLAAMEPLIRERAGQILDDLPVGEAFDWVDKVSIELTAMTLANLFDIPQADRRKLTRWSDVATASKESGVVASREARRLELLGCVDYFLRIWNARVDAPPRPDLISRLAHGRSTRDMDRMEYLGNLLLLIVGGNDTTRNTITGSVLALNRNPEQYDRLKADHRLIPAMVSESLRWQTPLAHMRRTATRDVEIGGVRIAKGDKVVMWYVSGNRDEAAIERPDDFWIERPNVRRHLSFGFGIHRCVGARLAELQLKIVWEEILKRFSHVEVRAEPRRVLSTFVRGYESMSVVLHA